MPFATSKPGFCYPKQVHKLHQPRFYDSSQFAKENPVSSRLIQFLRLLRLRFPHCCRDCKHGKAGKKRRLLGRGFHASIIRSPASDLVSSDIVSIGDAKMARVLALRTRWKPARSCTFPTTTSPACPLPSSPFRPLKGDVGLDGLHLRVL